MLCVVPDISAFRAQWKSVRQPLQVTLSCVMYESWCHAASECGFLVSGGLKHLWLLTDRRAFWPLKIASLIPKAFTCGKSGGRDNREKRLTLEMADVVAFIEMTAEARLVEVGVEIGTLLQDVETAKNKHCTGWRSSLHLQC